MDRNKYNTKSEYKLNKLEIISNNSRYDLSSIFVEVNLYESITSPFMSGDILIIDTNSTVNYLALGNLEQVVIDFKTKGTKQSIKYTGVIYKVSEPGRMNEHTSGYILHFTSLGMIKNTRTKVKTSFNTTNSNITKTLFDTFLKSDNKPYYDIETRNINHFVCPSITPLEVISLCARKSISNTKQSGYLFFEDNRQFNFVPVESLYTQKPVTSYYYRNDGIYKENVNQKEVETFNSIQDYEFLESPSRFNDIYTGLEGSKWSGFSLYDKKITTHTYDVNKDYNTKDMLSNHLFKKDVEFTNTSNEDLVTVNYRSVYNEQDRTRILNKMSLMKMESHKIKITIVGNSHLYAGCVINASIPIWSKNSNPNSRKVPDYLSGKFMVSEIRHILRKDIYNQVLKINKDSVETKV